MDKRITVFDFSNENEVDELNIKNLVDIFFYGSSVFYIKIDKAKKFYYLKRGEETYIYVYAARKMMKNTEFSRAGYITYIDDNKTFIFGNNKGDSERKNSKSMKMLSIKFNELYQKLFSIIELNI